MQFRRPSDVEAGFPAGPNPFADKYVRIGFIRKVYAILSVQILITFGIIAAFVFVPELTKFAKTQGLVMMGAGIGSFVLLLILTCCPNVARSFPQNFLLLFGFTVLTAISMAGTCVFYGREEIMWAAGITAGVFIMLTIFAMQTAIDFTACTGVTLVLVILLVIFGIVVSIFPSKTLIMVYSCGGAAIFCLFIVVDTQLIVGGSNRQCAVSPEDYIFGALTLYLDVINLFLFILQIMRSLDRDQYVLQISRLAQYKPHTTMMLGHDGEYILSGPLGNIFNSLVQVLRFNYTIGVPRELTTGSPQADGSWTGSMGMLHRNESDLAMGPFFPATERLEIALPSAVFYLEELRILAGRTTAQESSVFGYVLAFDWMVWMFLGVALLILSLITGLFNSMHAARSGRRYSFVGFVSDAIWQYVENLFFEASAHAPALGGERLLSAAWWLAVLVLMNAFCGHMRACLMIKSEVEKIESARQLVRRPHTVPYMWLGTSYVAMVAHSTNPELRHIGRVVRDRNTAKPASELYGQPLLQRVVQGRAAVISDGTSLVFRVSSVCQSFKGAEFYLAREGLVSHPLNSFARKDIDPTLFKDINKVIRRLVEAGLVNYWWTRATGDVSRCGGSSSSSSGPEQASTLGFADVFGVFVLWFACAGISALVFFAEICTPRTDEMSRKLAAAAASRCRHIWRAGKLRRSRSGV